MIQVLQKPAYPLLQCSSTTWSPTKESLWLGPNLPSKPHFRLPGQPSSLQPNLTSLQAEFTHSCPSGYSLGFFCCFLYTLQSGLCPIMFWRNDEQCLLCWPATWASGEGLFLLILNRWKSGDDRKLSVAFEKSGVSLCVWHPLGERWWDYEVTLLSAVQTLQAS